MLDLPREAIRHWLVDLFANAVKRLNNREDRLQAIKWLGQSREIVGSDLNLPEKVGRLRALIDSRTVVKFVAARVTESVRNYRKSNLPLAVKIAFPATLAALPFVGGQAAGIAAFGGAIGVPVLLLVFLGTAGITAIIEAVAKDPSVRPEVAEIIDLIIDDERLRQASWKIKAAMREQPCDPVRCATPENEDLLREALCRMDPCKFERHVMSFFESAGLKSIVTRKSNDLGVDGFAVHDHGLIVVQCKRNSAENKVGRPVIQQFKGVIEEHNAFHGFVVTTSTFSEEAEQSASMSKRMTLVDIHSLISWHVTAPIFDLGHA
ncbi:restriction endonuclease [Rhodopseudomonas sp. AAP120]|uniref:restriction endonuclease n=1 Tax=Rhodopseudomonas sp. AAP120 TaxID=1523430 RepID=UPI0006B88D0B|nr:restriction endonuclease [Rhodopseudomonas sp. AAP120]KPF89353.1 restriction endonuclease [Rhodopseudomonas sp. AAP120]